MKLSDFSTYPIIQAPMAGGATTPELVAAVCNAGAVGSLAAALLSPQRIAEQVEQIRALTSQPFAVNLFVLQTPQPSREVVDQGRHLLQAVCSALGWEEVPVPSKWCEDFPAQLEALIAARPAIASFTFDVLGKEQVERLHAAGIFVIGTATNVAEALAWQQAGADAICAQGIEAGGHRGTFIGSQLDGMGTLALVPQIVDAVRLPVIAAGGIMDGRGIAAAMKLGAQAAQLGTAFLGCPEAGIHSAYRQRLIEAAKEPAASLTRLTRAFSGRYARGLVNRFMEIMAPYEAEVPAYPLQNALTASMRAEAAKNKDTGLMSLWAGQGVGMLRPMPAAQLVSALIEEYQRAK